MARLDTQGINDRRSTLAAGVHTLRRGGFRVIELSWAFQWIARVPAVRRGRCTAFLPQFQLKLGQAGQNAGHHTPGGIGGVDAPQRAQLDIYADLFDEDLDGVADRLDAAINLLRTDCGRPGKRSGPILP